MRSVNPHYAKLSGAYLFPAIAARVRTFVDAHPDAASELIRCGIGDVTEPVPAAAINAMHDALDDLARRDSFHGYGPPTGYDWLREAIAAWDFAPRNAAIEPDEIFISDGAKGDCGHLLELLGPDVRVAVCDPVYPVSVDTMVMDGRTGGRDAQDRYAGIAYLPCTPDNGFVPDLPEERFDVVCLCYPNNPTGGMIRRDQLEAWVAYALEHDALILYDAAYMSFIRDPDLPHTIYEIPGADRCAIELHSFSKNGGFTGVRCGYTVCPKALMGTGGDGEPASLHAMWTRRWSTRANGVSYVVQRGAAGLYTDQGRAETKALIDHYMANARALRDGCASVGLDVFGGEHAPYVWVRCPDGVSSWDMFDRLLAEARLIVTPGAGFGPGGEGFIRISGFNSRDNVERAVERLASVGR